MRNGESSALKQHFAPSVISITSIRMIVISCVKCSNLLLLRFSVGQEARGKLQRSDLVILIILIKITAGGLKLRPCLKLGPIGQICRTNHSCLASCLMSKYIEHILSGFIWPFDTYPSTVCMFRGQNPWIRDNSNNKTLIILILFRLHNELKASIRGQLNGSHDGGLGLGLTSEISDQQLVENLQRQIALLTEEKNSAMQMWQETVQEMDRLTNEHRVRPLVQIQNLFFKIQIRKKYTSGPRYWNVPVLVNTGTFHVYQYCPEMWYLRSLEGAGGIQKQTILERQNGLVLSNTRVPVSGTWRILFPQIQNFVCKKCCFLWWWV